MPYTLFKTVAFGSGKANLTTVGYQLFNTDGSAAGSRSTAGVIHLGDGTYGAPVTFQDDFRGYIRWDTGEATPKYAAEEVNPEWASPTELVDVLLTRDWTAITKSVASRSVLNALRLLRNRWIRTATSLVVKKEDDTTDAWSANLAGNASLAPIADIDPS